MHTTTRRFVVAMAASGALVLAAPFVGIVRSQIRSAFPGQFSVIINGLVAAALGAAVVAGLARIRQHRLRRYGAMAMAVAGAAAYAGWTGSPDPNIAAVEHFHFVEYGTITFLFFRVWRDRGDWSAWLLPALAAFIVGMVEEAYQWFLPARVGELQDVWLNGIAIACGLVFSSGATPVQAFTTLWQPGSARAVLRAAALTVVAMAAFVHLVHLGVTIETQDAGTFVTRYTAGELAALDADRAAQWRQAPPLLPPRRFSREDQFMTEGLQHAQARNRHWAAGRITAAWCENVVLERFYPAVADTPSYISSAGLRWSAAQRADATARGAGPATHACVSDAYPYPLYLWPAAGLWVVASAAAAGLWLASLRLAGRTDTAGAA